MLLLCWTIGPIDWYRLHVLLIYHFPRLMFQKRFIKRDTVQGAWKKMFAFKIYSKSHRICSHASFSFTTFWNYRTETIGTMNFLLFIIWSGSSDSFGHTMTVCKSSVSLSEDQLLYRRTEIWNKGWYQCTVLRAMPDPENYKVHNRNDLTLKGEFPRIIIKDSVGNGKVNS